ncbi:ABC-F family ATP-binding cassette domain-containing protein [Aestuariimicrobium ganziense]|uniref:ABC-F family ATP-binding cassette domain-containing protein n=1 Tax=Aestuariimicrobium ganziense TaxID=2773677 RepID=UPI0019435336|nr:ABC-F family ATP-binding cassette domain-containing protein [Aestuariimicrobium ganziense]
MAFHPLIGTGLVRRYGDHTVLDGFSLTASPGQRVGLVGENGSGKSTLIRLLVGIDAPDDGTVTRPNDLGYLSQTPQFPADSTIEDALADALGDLHACLADLDRLAIAMGERPDDQQLHDDYAERLEWAEAHDAWDADRRATVAAHELGLDLEPQRLVSSLSGGQQVRLALACLIARRPECVVMDEPTNHLDDTALAMLEEFLVSLPGIVVVASHDRTFLDNACTHIVDTDHNPIGIDGQGGNTFAGTFSDYLDAKRAARARWEQLWAAQQDEIKKLERDLKVTSRSISNHTPVHARSDHSLATYDFKTGTVEKQVSRRVRAAQAKLDQAMQNQVRKPRKGLTFELPPLDAGASRTEISVRDLVLRERIHVPLLDVSSGDHLLLTGANGCGKSSLLKAIAGELEPTSGALFTPPGRIGYLPQDVTFAQPSWTVRATFQRLTGLDDRSSLMDLGLINGADLVRPVGALSVGQQRRFALAIVIAEHPRLLLLDEPTNHISLVLASELEDALQATPATVVVATHDRWLRRRWTGLVHEMPSLG